MADEEWFPEFEVGDEPFDPVHLVREVVTIAGVGDGSTPTREVRQNEGARGGEAAGNGAPTRSVGRQAVEKENRRSRADQLDLKAAMAGARPKVAHVVGSLHALLAQQGLCSPVCSRPE